MTTLGVRIIGVDLPGMRCADHEGVHVALERGNEQESVTRADVERARFDFTVNFVDGDFRGPYVTGKRGDRFIRLKWGALEESGEWNGFGRTKIHLTGHEDLAEEAVASGRRLEATVSLSGRNGGPALATVPPETIDWRLG